MGYDFRRYDRVKNGEGRTIAVIITAWFAVLWALAMIANGIGGMTKADDMGLIVLGGAGLALMVGTVARVCCLIAWEA